MRKLAYWIAGIAISSFIINIADDFFLSSYSVLMYSLPVFLIIEAVYLVFSLAFKRRIYIIISWYDLPSICFSIAIWEYIVAVNPMGGVMCKSLANLIEPGIFTAIACVIYGVRCYHAFNCNFARMERWGMVSAILIPVVAILFAFLFPGLSE